MLSPSPQSPSLLRALRALAAGALCAAHFYPLGGCGEIAPNDNGDAGSPHQGGDAGAPHDAATQTDAAGENSAHVRFEATAPGAGTLAIDASDAERWIYVDLDARREVFPSEPHSRLSMENPYTRF